MFLENKSLKTDGLIEKMLEQTKWEFEKNKKMYAKEIKKINFWRKSHCNVRLQIIYKGI